MTDAAEQVAATGDRPPRCDHICLLDEGHVERGEVHQYGYEIPSPRAGLAASPSEELLEAAEAYMEGHPCPLIDNHGGACFQTHQLKAALAALRTTKEGESDRR